MPLQYSVPLRNAQLDQLESTVGVNARLLLFFGPMPANCAASATGALLVDMALPADWMANAANGTKVKTGTWSGAGTAGAGTGTVAGYFRVVNAAGTVCHMQGTVTITGGNGDMQLDNPNIAQNQVVTINTFTISAGNA